MKLIGKEFGHEGRVTNASTATNVPAPPLYGLRRRTNLSLTLLSGQCVGSTVHLTAGWAISSLGLSITMQTVLIEIQNAEVLKKCEQLFAILIN